MKVFADYHTHTKHSHGKGSVEDNVKAAIKRGLTQVGIADHGPASHSVVRLGVKNPDELLDIKAEINRIQHHYPEIEILAGVEANVISLDGTLDVPYKILQQLDKILVGLHLFIIPKSLEDGRRIIFDNMIRYKIHKNDREEIRYHNTQALLNALKRYPIDVITHPGYQLDIDTVELARACVRANTALEINVSHGYLTEEFVKTAAAEGAKFVISSDAHTPENVGRVEVGVSMIEKLGIPKDQVLNIH